jgi:hypothetical protein
VTASEMREMWRSLIQHFGETITLQRVNPPAAKTVRGRVTGFTPQELTGGISQGSRKVILLAEDVETSGFPVPIKARSTDRIVAHGKTMMIEDVDTNTARVGDTLIAYLITATGA